MVLLQNLKLRRVAVWLGSARYGMARYGFIIGE